MDISVCPGCGSKLPFSAFTATSPFNASKECWEQYVNLSAYTLSLADSTFIHQHIVDAYEAQHAGPSVKPISTVFGLIGLYLALEKGYTGKQVQNAHKILADRNRVWPRLLPGVHVWPVTAAYIVSVGEKECKGKIDEWMKAVWNGWQKDQRQIRDLVDRFLFNG